MMELIMASLPLQQVSVTRFKEAALSNTHTHTHTHHMHSGMAGANVTPQLFNHFKWQSVQEEP